MKMMLIKMQKEQKIKFKEKQKQKMKKFTRQGQVGEQGTENAE